MRSCGSGLASRKGRNAAPALHAAKLKTWGRFAALSRRKAAPTRVRSRLAVGARQTTGADVLYDACHDQRPLRTTRPGP
ncbi:hypothetical protein E8E78_10010 [Pseudomonas sp. BN505]|nr:hypothetical protein [Pseudomonas sp. BN605]MDH4856924.1 hypothetical protein [Pseudomonas sp. BN505]ORL49582.1 hypothetical protein B7H18_21820 [Pseudomonas putida]